MTPSDDQIPPTHHQQRVDLGLERDTMRLERTVTDLRIAVAEGFTAVNTRLDLQKDHEPRLRAVERAQAQQITRDDVATMLKTALANQITRDDVDGMLKSAISSARRPTWRDVGALAAAIATSSGLVLGVAKVLIGT